MQTASSILTSYMQIRGEATAEAGVNSSLLNTLTIDMRENPPLFDAICSRLRNAHGDELIMWNKFKSFAGMHECAVLAMEWELINAARLANLQAAATKKLHAMSVYEASGFARQGKIHVDKLPARAVVTAVHPTLEAIDSILLAFLDLCFANTFNVKDEMIKLRDETLWFYRCMCSLLASDVDAVNLERTAIRWHKLQKELMAFLKNMDHLLLLFMPEAVKQTVNHLRDCSCQLSSALSVLRSGKDRLWKRGGRTVQQRNTVLIHIETRLRALDRQTERGTADANRNSGGPDDASKRTLVDALCSVQYLQMKYADAHNTETLNAAAQLAQQLESLPALLERQSAERSERQQKLIAKQLITAQLLSKDGKSLEDLEDSTDSNNVRDVDSVSDLLMQADFSEYRDIDNRTTSSREVCNVREHLILSSLLDISVLVEQLTAAFSTQTDMSSFTVTSTWHQLQVSLNRVVNSQNHSFNDVGHRSSVNANFTVACASDYGKA